MDHIIVTVVDTYNIYIYDVDVRMKSISCRRYQSPVAGEEFK